VGRCYRLEAALVGSDRARVRQMGTSVASLFLEDVVTVAEVVVEVVVVVVAAVEYDDDVTLTKLTLPWQN